MANLSFKKFLKVGNQTKNVKTVNIMSDKNIVISETDKNES